MLLNIFYLTGVFLILKKGKQLQLQPGFRPWGRGTYLGQGEGVPTLDGGGRGKGVPTPTLDDKGEPTLDGDGVPMLDRGGNPYLGQGVPTLDGGKGYLPWMGGRGYLLWTGCAAGGSPLVASRRKTFLFILVDGNGL